MPSTHFSPPCVTTSNCRPRVIIILSHLWKEGGRAGFFSDRFVLSRSGSASFGNHPEFPGKVFPPRRIRLLTLGMVEKGEGEICRFPRFRPDFHPDFHRRMITLPGITPRARANKVFPTEGPSPVFGYQVIDGHPLIGFPAVLTYVPVPRQHGLTRNPNPDLRPRYAVENLDYRRDGIPGAHGPQLTVLPLNYLGPSGKYHFNRAQSCANIQW